MADVSATPNLRPARTCRLETEAFSTEGLGVLRVEGREAISQPYAFDVVLAQRSDDADAPVDPDDAVGAQVRLIFDDPNGDTVRVVHGVVARARLRVDEKTNHPVYELHVVPRVHRLALVRTQELFLDCTIPEIIATKLERNGLVGYAEFRTTADYPQLELVVQYKESDLDFIERLSEHVGLAFHFEQRDHTEVMVFSDHNGGFPELGDVPFTGGGGVHGIRSLATESVMMPAVYGVQDYNYRRPDLDLGATTPIDKGYAGGVIEYGSHHKSPEDGERLARIRAEEAAGARRRHEGHAGVAGFSAGARLSLAEAHLVVDHPILLVEVQHHFEQTLGADDATNRYDNDFVAVATKHTYRPARRTPRPRIHGVVSAVVQPGASGEVGGLARLDDQGRYVVQFLFDTADYGDQKASRPVRMAQPFAGPDEGFHFPLKPGTEVLLAFVDGDPDRPVIVGALPNPQTPSPVTAVNSHLNRIQTANGVVIQFGRTS
jgi:type VI secretion system secreted protein VgrG